MHTSVDDDNVVSDLDCGHILADLFYSSKGYDADPSFFRLREVGGGEGASPAPTFFPPPPAAPARSSESCVRASSYESLRAGALLLSTLIALKDSLCFFVIF